MLTLCARLVQWLAEVLGSKFIDGDCSLNILVMYLQSRYILLADQVYGCWAVGLCESSYVEPPFEAISSF